MTPNPEASQSAHALQELMGVAGRRALITGAASGIGLAIARALLACGAKVLLTDRDATRLAAALESLRGLAGESRSAVADVTAPEQLAAAMAASRASSFMTGAVYVIDGGALLAYAT